MKILDCYRKNDVWVDESESSEFSKNQFQSEGHSEYNFEAPSDKWLEAKFNHVLSKFNGIGSGDCVFNEDYIYKKPLSFEKYNGSTILIFGGGPSTSKFLKETNFYGLPNFKDIDYNWSLNYFYRNNNLPKIDLAVIGKEVSKFDEDLNNYLESNSTDIVFEEDKDDMSGEIHLQNKFPKNTTFYKTRYASKIGIGVRMVIYAILLGVKNIYTIGLDGLTLNEDTEKNHSFQGDKKYGGKWGLNYEQKCHLTKRQFIVFWEYIMELQKERNFKINNLSEKYTDVSLFGKITKEWKGI